MNNQDRDPNRVSNQDIREVKTTERGVELSAGITEPSIELSETDTSNTENQTGNPGRTTDKAEDTHEAVEDDLEENKITITKTNN